VNVKGYSWLGVGTDQFSETLAFFSEVMGLSTVVVEERGVAILKVAEGQVLEIFGPGTEGRKLTSPPVVAFEVDDVAAARDELLQRGVEVLGEVGSWNGFEWLKFRGPGGHVFALQKTANTGWEKTI
jgi:predicted enzyme related to lactoylglutathione lyase